jgi:Asp-tRNA(Asn)/Glu-tRNA(Gln) amidotransferase A subunit family amidase
MSKVIYLLAFGLVLSSSLKGQSIDAGSVKASEKIIGVSFTQGEIDSMLPLLLDQLKNYENMRKVALPNNVPLAYNFNPLPTGKKFDQIKKSFKASDYSKTVRPQDINDLAFYSIGQLAELIRTKKLSSMELTKFYIDRLRKYAPQLHCVITYTDTVALSQARLADAEIADGKYRGLLHGIPYGIKDMYSTKHYPTTYGTPPYKNQVIEEDATIVKKLNEAGAVMIAKLSLGELAMDDVWHGGQTRNPWDTAHGSSGSSAGPASAVSAGLVPFAIGSETWGSIVSPSTICGVTGLRPTYGRISRYGAMALSWTMDKVGPICRNAEDCAIVLNSTYSYDPKDAATNEIPLSYAPEVNIKGLKVGYFAEDFAGDSLNKKYDDAAIEKLKSMGAELIPLHLPKLPVNDMSLLLVCEGASAFDDLTLSNKDDQMVQQNKDRWPNIFRAAHMIPATEYIRANRLRYLLIQQMEEIMSRVDVCIAPSLSGDNLLVTNLTGHPSIVVPNGFIDAKTPTSIVFIGQLYEDGKLIAVAKKYQDATSHHTQHPPLFK